MATQSKVQPDPSKLTRGGLVTLLSGAFLSVMSAIIDARADLARFEAAGLQVFAPFDFERQARLPDGTIDTVAFTLGFARSPDMPRIAFFVCENRAQQYFWKSEFQTHENGAQGITTVYLSSLS